MAEGLGGEEDYQRAEIADGPSALMPPLMAWEKLKLNLEPKMKMRSWHRGHTPFLLREEPQ